MRVRDVLLIFGLALGALASVAEAAEPDGDGEVPAAPRYVILLISDGAGFAHFQAASLWAHGRRGGQACYGFPVRLAMSTYAVRGSYDPIAAATHWKYGRGGATDSAAAITAMVSGTKTENGRLGVDVEGRPLTSVIDLVEARGMASGVVTSVPFSHATPAGVVVHVESRKDYGTIARQMLFESGLDVVMGAGHPGYDHDGRRREDGPRYKYFGDETAWRRLLDPEGEPGADADGDGEPDRWTVVHSRPAVRALADGPTPKRLCVLPRVAATLQQRRGGNREAAPFEVPPTPDVPTLAEMTRAALNALDEDPDGFFLMVEGGAVDWASHGNQLGRMIEEQRDFDAATNAVLAWVEARDAWAETLIVVTSDHECGYLTGPEQEGAWPLDAAPPWWRAPLEGRGAGRLPPATWRSKRHSNLLLPFFARGPGSETFVAAATRRDPLHGPYLDNSDLGNVLQALLRTPAGE